MEKFDANKIEVTEQEKIAAIDQLSKDMTKHFSIQADIKKMVRLIRATLFVSSIVAVLMMGSIIYLLMKPPNATEATLQWVADQMGNISTQKKLNMMDRQDIDKAREDFKKMQLQLNKRDSMFIIKNSK